MTKASVIIHCGVCRDTFVGDLMDELCPICALDTRETSEQWDAIRLAEFTRQRNAEIDAQHRAQIFTRKLTDELVAIMTPDQRRQFAGRLGQAYMPVTPVAEAPAPAVVADWEAALAHQRPARCRRILELCSAAPRTGHQLCAGLRPLTISLATVYRDIEHLLSMGALERVRGGVRTKEQRA